MNVSERQTTFVLFCSSFVMYSKSHGWDERGDANDECCQRVRVDIDDLHVTVVVEAVDPAGDDVDGGSVSMLCWKRASCSPSRTV